MPLQFSRVVNYNIYKRVKLVQELSTLTEVPFEDMLVYNVQEANIKGRDCLTASLWITGENGAWRMHIYELAIYLCISLYTFALYT